MSAADTAANTATTLEGAYTTEKGKFTAINEIGKALVGNVEGRWLWPEMLTALNQCLPSDPEGARPEKIGQRNEIHITTLECEWFADLGSWYNGGIKEKIEAVQNAMKVPPMPAPGAAPAEPGAEGAPAEGVADPAAAIDPNAQQPPAEAIPDPGPTGPGWVIELRGHHFHNEDLIDRTAKFVRDTLIENLRNKKVTIVNPDDGKPMEISMKELGIGYPVILTEQSNYFDTEVADSNGTPIRVRRWDFEVQFAWQPTTHTQRLEKKQATEQQQPAELAAGGTQ
jgi:hypothetical protein